MYKQKQLINSCSLISYKYINWKSQTKSQLPCIWSPESDTRQCWLFWASPHEDLVRTNDAPHQQALDRHLMCSHSLQITVTVVTLFCFFSYISPYFWFAIFNISFQTIFWHFNFLLSDSKYLSLYINDSKLSIDIP